MQHPASLMIKTWVFCTALWIIMPFQLLGRQTTAYGSAMLIICIGLFCVGSWLGGSPKTQPEAEEFPQNHGWLKADCVLMAVSLLASAMLFVEFARGNYLDLGGAYLERMDRAQAVLTGSASSASALFQIGFIAYPVGYVYLVRGITFERKLNFLRIGLFGALPPALASVVMGGRSPLLYAAFIVFIAYRQRKLLFPVTQAAVERKFNWPAVIIGSVFGLVMLNYFAQVFIVRADSGGGIEAAYDNAAYNWGVTFEGPIADAMRTILGEGNTFLVFIFAWYIVQGIPMSNVIFSHYMGEPTWGAYGVDLITAVSRRLSGDVLADRFAELLQLNVYGFLPSAFGTAFIDFRYFSLLVIPLWGWLAGFVYRRVKQRRDSRWLLWTPFVVTGIVFSVMNTPLGFSNGLVSHFWCFAAFWLAPRVVNSGSLAK